MTQNASTSVFTDDSGARRRVLVWTLRGVIAALALSVAAFAFTLVTDVSLPALGGPLGDEGSSSRGAADPAQTNGSDSTAPGASPTADATPSADTLRPASDASTGTATPGAKPTTTPSATPTASATPGSKATNRGGSSLDAPRADPTNDPHDPIKTPPGRTK